jgi:ketosteroid isomerase-like protein
VHENEERVRSAFDAYARKDIAGAQDLLADDVTWHFAGRHPFSGDYTGKETVQDVWARRRKLTGGTLSYDVHDVLANDEHVVVLLLNKAERDGRTLEWRSVSVYHMKGGKMTEPQDQNSSTACWSSLWSHASVILPPFMW